jgi:hypothetical protein
MPETLVLQFLTHPEDGLEEYGCSYGWHKSPFLICNRACKLSGIKYSCFELLTRNSCEIGTQTKRIISTSTYRKSTHVITYQHSAVLFLLIHLHREEGEVLSQSILICDACLSLSLSLLSNCRKGLSPDVQ